MQEPIRSAARPRGWGRSKALGGALALTIATFGSVAAVTAGTASAASTYSPVVTQDYTVGSAASSVSSVTASVSPTTPNTTASYSVKFTTPAALTVGASASSIQIAGTGLTANPTSVSVADLNTGFASTETGTVNAGTLTVVLSTGTSTFNSGDTILVSFQATTPNVVSSTSYTFSVTTSASTTAATANTITISPTVTAPKAAQSSQVLGAGSTYSLSSIAVLTSTSSTLTSTNVTLLACPSSSGASGTGQSLSLPSVCASPNAGGITWSTAAGSYAVTQYTSTGTATAAITVNSATATTNGVILNISGGTASATTGILTAGDNLTVTGTGTNPTSAVSDVLVAGISDPAPAYYEESGNTVAFGGQITGLTVTPAPASSGSTAIYTLNFTTSSSGALVAGNSITVVAPKGTSFTSSVGAVVTDTKTGISEVVAGANNGLTTTTNTDDTVVLPVNFNVAAGDPLSVVLFNVVNPAAGSYGGTSGFTVSTSTDIIAATNATAYTITPAEVSSQSPTVTLSDSATGALSNYTIASFKAASALVGGTDTIEVKAPTGTLLPSAATLTDSTTSTGTQTITASTGAGTADATYKLSANVAANDLLSLSLSNVINPGTSSTTEQITLGADNATTNATVAGTQGLATILPSFPAVASAAGYPDAGIVNFSGTFYVFAGGHAFGIPTPAALNAIRAVDPAVPQNAPSGATVPATAPAMGTLIVAYNNPTIYVVGADGQLHGFATTAEFMSLGYDPADVITVPGTGGIKVGANLGTLGAAGNAFATESNGAIVNSSNTFYVFAGGKAFGIPGVKALKAVQAADMATTLTGAVTTAQTSATPRNGTLYTYGGGVWVVSGGNLYQFKGMVQLKNDGYGGTPSFVIPNTGGLSIVTSYSGS